MASRSLRPPEPQELSLRYPHLVPCEAELCGKVEEYEEWRATDVRLQRDADPLADLSPDQKWLLHVMVGGGGAAAGPAECQAAPPAQRPRPRPGGVLPGQR